MDFKPVRVVIIPPGGEPAEARVIGQDLRNLQSIVGGYIEAVNTMYDDAGTPQAVFWCNEEGKLQNLPINARATALWYAIEGGPTGDHLCGTVILTGGADRDGDILPTPQVLVDGLSFLNDDQ
jgi:hypothetical protein